VPGGKSLSLSTWWKVRRVEARPQEKNIFSYERGYIPLNARLLQLYGEDVRMTFALSTCQLSTAGFPSLLSRIMLATYGKSNMLRVLNLSETQVPVGIN
jgi:hypothetical protein